MATAPCQGGPALLSRKAAAELLGVKTQTLANWRTTGRYALPVVKVGRLAKYRLSDLQAFVERNVVGDVQDEGEGL